ncbi:type IX secretion system membrane protein PorP/SprF [Maribacter sp. 2307ULW6-5]|uniref:PorP/SprF family type IX secretion system membrane protein n=1 Tax=Maribacter sp. 2307ULW6-5 TaxID=3386275 RepID=UPI0039BC6C89
MKFNKITPLFILFALGVSLGLQAQQDPNYTFYRFNMNLVNPAFAGAGETAKVGVNVRSQWAGVQGAPETQSVVFGMPVGRNVGLGLSVINDKTFVENQTSVALDFSYKLKLDEAHDLYFGLKGSFASYDVNSEGLLTYGIQPDMSLMNIDGRFTPNVGAGLLLRNERYFVSLSIPKILTPDRLEQKDGMARLGVDEVHYYLAGGYDVVLSESVVLKPSALIRYVNASPLSVDVTGLVEFNDRIDLGAAYRVSESVSGIFMFKAGKLDIGYAYEMALESNVRNIDQGTHEIMMQIHF